MAQYERFSPGSEPSFGPRDATKGFPGTEGFAVFGSFMNSAMRGNLEAMSLASRRARAAMELTRQLGSCRNPADFGQSCTAFWKEAMHDYTEYNQKLTSAWVEAWSAVGQGNLARSAVDTAKRTFEPMADAVEGASSAMSEHPTEPWAWWRTDMKGLKTGAPRPNAGRDEYTSFRPS